MAKGLILILGTMFGIALLTGLYLLVRSYHHQWKWQNRVNENRIRQAILEEADIQFEVAPDGFVRPVQRKRREYSAQV